MSGINTPIFSSYMNYPNASWNVSNTFNSTIYEHGVSRISKDGNSALILHEAISDISMYILANQYDTISDISIYTLINDSWVQKGSTFTNGKNGAINDNGSKVIIRTADNVLTLYEWDGNSWITKASILNVLYEGGTEMISDSSIFIVGERKYSNSIGNIGRARVFSYNNGSINQIGGDFIEDGNNRTGHYLDINSSGTIISLFLAEDIVRIFKRDEDKLSEDTDVSSPNFGPIGWTRMGNDFELEYSNGWFSYPRLSSDGYTVVIGDEINSDAGEYAGHMRVFSWNGTEWVQKGNDIDGPVPYSGYGWVTGINGDGTVVVSASYYKEVPNGFGQARVFHWTGTNSSDGSWKQLGNTLFSPLSSNVNDFGNNLSIDATGSRLLISAYTQTYIFDLILGEPTISTPTQVIGMMFNNMTYYKSGSLGSGHGTTVNSRLKRRRT